MLSSQEKTRAPRKPGHQWSKEEDAKLCKAVEHYGTEDWNFIAQVVGGGRTRQQCHQRWFRGLDPSISRERWTLDEEALLMKLVKENGLKAWTKIAKKMGTRNDVQCRYHYKQILKRNIPKANNENQSSPNPEPAINYSSSPAHQIIQEYPNFNEMVPQYHETTEEQINKLDDKISSIFDGFGFIEDLEWKSNSFFSLF